MRIRGLLIAVLVLAALGGAVWWSEKAKKAEEGKPPADAPPKILTIPEDQLQQIEIRKAGAESTVVRKNNQNKWEITAPTPLPVDQDAMTGMVSTLSSLEAGRLVEEKTADPGQFGLTAPSLQVTVKKKDGKTHTLLIGDESPAGGGNFVMLAGDPRVFTIAGFNKTNIDKTARDLRDKRLLTFDSEKLSRVELAAKGEPLEFGKNAQNDWQLIRPKPLRADGGQVEELVRKLKDAKMDTTGTAEDEKKWAAGFAKGTKVATAKMTDASGTQEMEVRKDKDNNYYARSSVVEGTHKLTSSIGEGLDKGLEDFRNKKLFDFGWNDPTKVEIREGSKQVAFQKSGEKWMAGPKQMDSPSVQAVIDKLRDLSAIKFPDKGFTTPLLEATVTSNDGKRIEKVLVSKEGSACYGKRENEPSIYELDGKIVEELQKAVAEVKEFQPPKGEKKK